MIQDIKLHQNIVNLLRKEQGPGSITWAAEVIYPLYAQICKEKKMEPLVTQFSHMWVRATKEYERKFLHRPHDK